MENLDLNVEAPYYFLNSQYFTEKYTIIKSRYDILKVNADLDVYVSPFSAVLAYKR
ncbi:hypothetical protein [Lacrimispora amygdalina]|uniref:hypothetical protein n=1 Tax=Lacrimispora amygdalina TaxID=253257 RepID=UPI001479365B|nr:hypothetical protein [Clostridium indicum]